jgi:hypothetical protein
MRSSAGTYGDFRFPTTSGIGDYAMLNGGTHPSLGSGLPTTVAYDKAAAALNPQVTSGGSYMLSLDTEGNPFSALEHKGAPMKEEYLERALNGEAKMQVREPMQANGIGGSGFTGIGLESGTSPYGGLSSFDYGALPPGMQSSTTGESNDQLRSNDLANYGRRAAPREPVAALHDGMPQPFLQTRNLAEEVTAPSKYNGPGDFNFPKTGSFVAAPYDGDGLPYYDQPSKSYPSTYEGSRSYSKTYESAPQASRGTYYDAHSAMPNGMYEDGRVRRGMATSMRPMNGYDSHFQDGLLEYRNGAQEIGSSYLYGQPPGGRVSYERIGSPMPGSPMLGSRQVGPVLATSGSFVASPFAEGAPTLDFLPPVKSSSSYAPPPTGFSTLAPSGSFVASPFAVGAPTPDMLGMSLFPRGQNAYPETYGSIPPSLYGMGPSLGGGNRYASPFPGYDAEVPGRFEAGTFGANSQLGKGSSMEGGRGSILYGSKADYAPSDKDKLPKGEQRGREEVDLNPNEKQNMPRSREREDAAPRLKRKGERRACC